MQNNLWEILEYSDLIRLLHQGKNKFIILTLVDNNTSQSIKTMLKRFIREKSKIYKNATFLFYKVKKCDLGMLPPMIEDDNRYPKMFHLYDVNEILGGVLMIDNEKVLEKHFKENHDEYLKGFIENTNKNDDKINNDSNNEETVSSKKETAQKPSQQSPPQQLQSMVVQPIVQRKNPELEKKKYMEKIELLREKQEIYLVKFFKDCKKRKAEEEKTKV
jgi:hypothetical protein